MDLELCVSCEEILYDDAVYLTDEGDVLCERCWVRLQPDSLEDEYDRENWLDEK